MKNDEKLEPPKFVLPEKEADKKVLNEVVKEKKRGALALTRREIAVIGIAGVLLLALAVVLFIFISRAGRSPAQLVNQHAGENKAFAVQQEITMVNLPGASEQFAYVYLGSGGVNCAVMERGIFGYNVMQTAGTLPASSSEEGKWIATAYDSSAKNYVVFGVLHDKTLSHVTVDGKAATVIDTGKYRCWVYVGQGDVTIGSESVKYK